MKKFLSLLLMIAITATFFVGVPATASGGGGGGGAIVIGYGPNGKFLAPIGSPDAESTPISTRAELEGIANNLSGKYHLISNIDLSGVEWMPIGGESDAFTGTFDGQGYVISNLTVTGNHMYSGLFGVAEAATIKNVGMEGTRINATSDSIAIVGAICGSAEYVDIRNCYNTGEVSASPANTDSNYFAFAGGICGKSFDYATITNCYNTGKISTSATFGPDVDAGGICGFNDGTISNCYNTGDVFAQSSAKEIDEASSANAGGICSFNAGTINNCYNTGEIAADAKGAYAGGISGIVFQIIDKCYNTGVISAKYAGGICGFSPELGPITNSYCLDLYDSTHGMVLTTEQMKSNYSFVDFDFDTVWRIAQTANNGYPHLYIIPVIQITTQPKDKTFTIENITGAVTVEATVTQGLNPSYQWYSNTENSNSEGTEIVGATAASYAIPTDLNTGIYYYFCEVSAADSEPVRSDVSVVTVNNAPHYHTYTLSINKTTLCWGENLILSGTSSASSTLEYQLELFGFMPIKGYLFAANNKFEHTINTSSLFMDTYSVKVGLGNSFSNSCVFTVINKVAPIIASPQSSKVSAGTKITLSTGTPNATIYYTLDGSMPTRSSTLYNNGFIINSTTMIKAFAVRDDNDTTPSLRDSDIFTQTYTVDTGGDSSDSSGGGGSRGGGGGGGSRGGGGGIVLPPAPPPAPVIITESAVNNFTDINENDWFYNAIKFTVDKRLFNGISQNQFAPKVQMSRAMFITVLARYADVDTAGGEQWWSNAVAWGIESGITDGTNLEDSITREQLAVLLWRYAGSPTATGNLSDFSDENIISDWAIDAMRWAIGAGLIGGYTDSTVKPGGYATRAEVATIINRFAEVMEQ